MTTLSLVTGGSPVLILFTTINIARVDNLPQQAYAKAV